MLMSYSLGLSFFKTSPGSFSVCVSPGKEFWYVIAAAAGPVLKKSEFMECEELK